MATKEYQICSNCVMDTTDSKIVFDENGVCDHCNTFYNSIKPFWNPNEKGNKELMELIEKIKSEGKDKDFD